MKAPAFVPVLALFLALSTPCRAAPECAGDIGTLREILGDPAFPLVWRETTMSDGKPLILSIRERDGALLLTFVKSREGLWAEGTGMICERDSRLEARFAPGKMVVGPAAHWAMRLALRGAPSFTLVRTGATSMSIATRGWSGVFSARGD